MSTHIKIDRCDTPKLRLLKSYSLGDLWKCDCGQEWRWSSWHRQVAYKGMRSAGWSCAETKGWSKTSDEYLHSPICTHYPRSSK